MKRFFKKSVAIALCLCMVLCAVPLSVFAQTDDVQTDVENDVSMEATSAFGEMLTDSIETQELDADSPYFISDLIFDGNNATASYYNELACTLVVAVYDEETNQMLSSAVIAVEAESLEATVSFSSLPENFVAKAFLLDENNASLCKPYTCNENTTVYEEFMSKTTEDFDEDRVIDLDESLTNNFVVLSDETIIVSGSDTSNVLESADTENDEYVFTNIDEQIENLNVGDTFYLDNGDLENITVIKIASISIEGDKAVIAADDTTLAEAFDYVKINTEADAEDMVYDGSGADEGVTYLGDVDYETGEAVAPANSGIMTLGVEITGENSVSKKLEYKEDNVTATAIFKADINLKVFIGSGYGEVSFTVDPSAKLTVEVESKVPKKEISFGKIAVAGISGAKVYINPTLVFEFSGKITVSGELTFTLGMGWNSNSGFVNKCKKPSFKPVVKVEATLFIGFDLNPEFVVIHENLASASLSGVVGAEIAAELTNDNGENHSCESCIDGEINGKVDISVKLSIAKKVPIIGGEWDKDLFSKTIKIADFYFSLTYVSFGWEECPYENGSSGGDSGDSGESGGDSGESGDTGEGGDDLPYYTLVFLDADGSAFTVEDLRYGADVCDYIPDKTPEKEYHRFIEWYDADGKRPSDYNWMPAHDVTFFPMFERLPVKLVPAAGSTTVIDYDYNYIYGLQERLTINKLVSDYLSVINGGYFVVTSVEGYGGVAGTGAVVKLYDSIDNSLLESFYVVIFGDLNGDSMINATDVKIVEDEATGITSWSHEVSLDYSPSKLMAADLYKDGRVNCLDCSIIYSAALGTAIIDQMTGEWDGEIVDAVSVGDIIEFGSYPQSLQDDGTYKVEPIEWRVLENNNGELLLLSEKVLDLQPYHNVDEEITWAECSLRSWLNDDFYNTAFSESEKVLISTTLLTNGDSSQFGTEGGSDTQDKVFLLSYSDSVNSDFGFNLDWTAEDPARIADMTYYSAKAPDGEFSYSNNGNWWLRTYGCNDFPYLVSMNGAISLVGDPDLNLVFYGVRPALKLNLYSSVSSAETQAASYSLMRSGVQTLTLENGVDTLGFSYDKCIAGNAYTLLNVTDYGEGFELSSDNLYYINTVSADESGTVTASFIPKANAENSEILLIGDFGSGTETVVIDSWYNEYNVTWNTDGETVTQTVIEGAEIIAPENPEKTGYTFTGWTPSIPDAMPDYDLTFTAIWAVNSYDAVFDANGGKWADSTTEMTVPTDYDAEIIAPENPAKQGYIFSCWTPDIGIMDDVNGKKFSAVWLASTDTLYTVETYTMNTAGEYELSTQVLSGTTGETAEINPEIKTGFSLNAEKSVLSGEIATDNSLILKVYIDRNAYTLTTVVDGVSTETKYYYGSIVAEPAAPVKSGYKFVEWDNEIPSTMPAENVTLTAVFEKSYICPECGNEILGEDEINTHIAAENAAKIKITVKIENNSGSKTINYGETLRLTAVTTDMPANAKIYWYVDGVKKGEGETFNVSFESGTKTVEVKLVDANGNVIKNASGNEISDSEEVNVKSGFFQKIISFFKNLFGMNRIVIQSILKNSL